MTAFITLFLHNFNNVYSRVYGFDSMFSNLIIMFV